MCTYLSVCFPHSLIMLIDQGFGDYQCWENNRKRLSFPKASYVTLVLREGSSYACSIFLLSDWRLYQCNAVACSELLKPPSQPPYLPPTETAYSVHSKNRSSTRPPHGSTALPHNTHNYNKLDLGNSFRTFDANCDPWPFAYITCMQMCT